MNAELTMQLAQLRRARPRSERMRALEAQLMLPFAMATSEPARGEQEPSDSSSDDSHESNKHRGKKKRRGKHPGRNPLPADLERVPQYNYSGGSTTLSRVWRGDEVTRCHPLRALGHYSCEGRRGAPHRRGAQMSLGRHDRVGTTAAAHRGKRRPGQ